MLVSCKICGGHANVTPTINPFDRNLEEIHHRILHKFEEQIKSTFVIRIGPISQSIQSKADIGIYIKSLPTIPQRGRRPRPWTLIYAWKK